MNSKPSRRSSLFLIEFMIALLFFSLTAGICVQFFIKARLLEQDSVDLNHAVNAASSIAELIEQQEDPFTLLKELYPLGEADDDAYTVFYNKDWRLCTSQDAVYIACLNIEYLDPFLISKIQITTDSDTIYELTAKNYQKKEGASP